MVIRKKERSQGKVFDMKKVITYGTYDCLHYGHINLLKKAKELGDYLIVGVTSDEYDKVRGKLDVKQPLVDRIKAVRDTGIADEIIVEEYDGQKIIDIQKYGVDYFTVGSDWVGHFDYLNEFCEVIYLPRTEGVSSTEIRTASNPVIKLGIAGSYNPAERVLDELGYIRSIEAVAIWDGYGEKGKEIAESRGLSFFDDYEKMLDEVDAVYIVSPIDKHYELIMKALDHDCHIACEGAMFMRVSEANEAFDKAKEKNLLLFDAIKTRYFPAYEHLILLLKTGCIGQVKDIDVSFSQKLDGVDYSKMDKYMGGIYNLGGFIFLPVVEILGTSIKEKYFFTNKKGDFDSFTQGLIKYDEALASFKAGLGFKTEGDMIITGTEGYIYIPAPWWKTDYFEIRYEDPRLTKKNFWQYKGEGFRYEFIEFARLINNKEYVSGKLPREEVVKIAELIEYFDEGNYKEF